MELSSVLSITTMVLFCAAVFNLCLGQGWPRRLVLLVTFLFFAIPTVPFFLAAAVPGGGIDLSMISDALALVQMAVLFILSRSILAKLTVKEG